MTSEVIPLVENRSKTESALRFAKQKTDPRSVLDPKKIKKYYESGKYAPPVGRRIGGRQAWGRVGGASCGFGKVSRRIIISNEHYCEMTKTSRPQLKKKKELAKKAEDEEDMDALSKSVCSKGTRNLGVC